MKKFTTIRLIGIGIIIVLFTIISTSITSFGWGDNSGLKGMRPSYSLQEISEKAGEFGNTPFFNSIEIKDSDYTWYKNTFGEELKKGNLRYEKNFVGARENTGVNAGPANVWDGNNITVEDGKTYLVRIYAHNNNPNGLDAVAENTKVAFDIPDSSEYTNIEIEDENGAKIGEKQGYRTQINGLISSSNASPSKYWDYVNFNSNHAFHLEYVYGSALLENTGAAAGPLSDAVIDYANGGTLIGYDALDGRIPGCYQYASYITIKVKAVYDYEFSVEKKVRLAGNKEWKEEVDAKVGDKVEFRIEYKNTSDEWQNGVTLKCTLPDNLRYVSGSAEIKNASYREYETVTDDYIVTTGLLIGNYSPGSNAFLRFTTEVVDDNLACGKNLLMNWVQAGVGDTTLQDDARVNLYKTATWVNNLELIAYIIVVLIMVLVIVVTINNFFL